MQPDRPAARESTAPEDTAPDASGLSDRQRQAFASLGDRLARLPDSHPSAPGFTQERRKLLNDSPVADVPSPGGAAPVADAGERRGAGAGERRGAGAGERRGAAAAPVGEAGVRWGARDGAAPVGEAGVRWGARDGAAPVGEAGARDGAALGAGAGEARGERAAAGDGRSADGALGKFVPGAGGRQPGEATGLGGRLARSLAAREAAGDGRASGPGRSAGRAPDRATHAGPDHAGPDHAGWRVMPGMAGRRDAYRPWFYGSGEPWFSADWTGTGPGWFGATPGRSS
jgi:hypothetical protein